MNKKLKNALAATGAVAVAAAAVYGLNVLDEKRDRKRYPQSGRMVEVRGRKMHICGTGAGSNTVVLLTGCGTPTPSLDFKPLADRLSGSYKVVIPEPFGYGYSDATTEPRTVRNMVDETREGLRKAGYFPPYILVGHAMGGISTLYWAAHYPREVAAVVGIDTTLPAQGSSFACCAAARPLSRAAAFLARVTPLRLLIKAGILDDSLRPYTGGDDERLPIVRAHEANSRTSVTAANERIAVEQNCSEVAGLNYPASCPVLMLVASESCAQVSSDPGLTTDWLAEHEKIAMHAHRGKCVLLEGGHYLHHTAAEAIAAEIMSFVPAEEQQTPRLRTFLNRK